MRLLNVETIKLEEFFDNSIPSHTILHILGAKMKLYSETSILSLDFDVNLSRLMVAVPRL
jgi:hypothetical protein